MLINHTYSNIYHEINIITLVFLVGLNEFTGGVLLGSGARQVAEGVGAVLMMRGDHLVYLLQGLDHVDVLLRSGGCKQWLRKSSFFVSTHEDFYFLESSSRL